MKNIELLDEREAAQFLRLSVSTLQQRRFRRKDPVYIKLGKSIRYHIQDLEKFIEGCRINPARDDKPFGE